MTKDAKIHRLPAQIRGNPIIDGNYDIGFNIGNSDIKGARKKDPTSCAAARALIREHKLAEVCVMRRRTYVNVGTKNSPKWLRYITPESLAREIVAIDRGGTFEPGYYKLRAPCESQKLGIKRGKPGNRGASGKIKKAEPRYRHVTANIRQA